MSLEVWGSYGHFVFCIACISYGVPPGVESSKCIPEKGRLLSTLAATEAVEYSNDLF